MYYSSSAVSRDLTDPWSNPRPLHVTNFSQSEATFEMTEDHAVDVESLAS